MNQTLIMRQEKYWFSVLPSGWQKGRIKDVFNQISNNGTNLEEGTYIPLENLESYTGKLIRRVNNENNETTNLFRKGDILLNKLRPYLAKVHLAEFNGGVSGEVIVLRTSAIWKRYTSNKYFFYLFLSSAFINKINSMSEGVKMPRTNPSKILALEIAIPSLEEQTAIAEYLDTKTQAIDKKVSLLEKKIGYYQELRKSLINETVTKGLDKNAKLKDSGIDWIGQIPEHWEVKRLKEIISRNDGGVWGQFDDDGTFVIRSTEINIDGSWNFENVAKISLTKGEIRGSLLLEGDLVITKSSGSELHIGKTAIVSQEIEKQQCCYSNFMQRIRLSKRHHPRFYFYCLNSPLFRFQYNYFSKSTTGLANLNADLINQLTCTIPPLNEQKEIAKFLDAKLDTIAKIIANIQTQITTLKELRKTLINDVVTGKIKVSHE